MMMVAESEFLAIDLPHAARTTAGNLTTVPIFAFPRPGRPTHSIGYAK